MDAEPATVAKSAIKILFPNAGIITVASLAEALALPQSHANVEILIAGHTVGADFIRAANSTDHQGLPRWATLAVSDEIATDDLRFISPADWNVRNATRELHHSIQFHKLARENARLRGDLLTLSHRISHDLRTALGGITSSGEVLKQVVSEIDPGHAELVRPLFDSADDLSRLISRTSHMLKASAHPTPKHRMAMGDVVWAALQRLERQFLRRQLNVLQPELWPEVEGVTTWLEAVWSNLLKNAQQQAPANSTIKLGWRLKETDFHFWVQNEGESVAPEKRATLFQPFHLLHQSNARKGLGLSIVQRLVELQGGACYYEPATDGGSVFAFTLPKATLESEATPLETVRVDNPSPFPCSA